MKVQLIVVQGKPEGKTIPLATPTFRIGRGDTCNLRPSSELVSREHAEFAVKADRVTVRDLGSRNGTLVNGKVISAEQILKDNDTVTVGNLTFAVSIQDAPKASANPAASAPPKPVAKAVKSLDDASNAEIDSWLLGDSNGPVPDSPSGVYGGETRTIETYQGELKEKENVVPTPAPVVAASPAPSPPKPAVIPPKPAPVPVITPAPVPVAKVEVEEEEFVAEEEEYSDEYVPDEDDGEPDPADEFIDESNPFYVAKKKPTESTPSGDSAKQAYADTSVAANDILRKMMERRRASK